MRALGRRLEAAYGRVAALRSQIRANKLATTSANARAEIAALSADVARKEAARVRAQLQDEEAELVASTLARLYDGGGDRRTPEPFLSPMRASHPLEFDDSEEEDAF